MYGSCGECDRLWLEYGEMLRDYLRLVANSRSRQFGKIRPLSPKLTCWYPMPRRRAGTPGRPLGITTPLTQRKH
jgi:hypothetical protein